MTFRSPYQVQKDVENVLKGHVSEKLQIKQNLDEIKVKTAQVRVINQALQTADEATAAVLLDNKKDLIVDISSLNSSNQSLWQSILNDRIVMINQIKSNNDAIGAVELFDINEQLVNDIYLNKVIFDTDNFTTDEVQKLYNIANQCPLTGGKAVFAARSLYSLVDRTAFFDNSDCGIAGFREAEENTEVNETGEKTFVFYPNPVEHQLTIESINSNQFDKIEIINTFGKVIFSLENDSQKIVSISTTNLPTGIHLVRVLNKDAILCTEKVVFIH